MPLGRLPKRVAVLEAGNRARRAALEMVVHDALAEQAGLVAEPVGEARRLAAQQDLGGPERARAQEDHARPELERLFRLAVHDAHARDAVGRLVVDERVHDRVGPDGQVAGCLRGGERGRERAEVGARRAAAVARAAVVAARPALVRLRQDRRAADRHRAPGVAARDRLLDVRLGRRHRHRRQKLAVGKLPEPARLARDADKALDVAVPRRDVGVSDRPARAAPLALVGP